MSRNLVTSACRFMNVDNVNFILKFSFTEVGNRSLIKYNQLLGNQTNTNKQLMTLCKERLRVGGSHVCVWVTWVTCLSVWWALTGHISVTTFHIFDLILKDIHPFCKFGLLPTRTRWRELQPLRHHYRWVRRRFYPSHGTLDLTFDCFYT